jgi:hypothetical protein
MRLGLLRAVPHWSGKAENRLSSCGFQRLNGGLLAYTHPADAETSVRPPRLSPGQRSCHGACDLYRIEGTITITGLLEKNLNPVEGADPS